MKFVTAFQKCSPLRIFGIFLFFLFSRLHVEYSAINQFLKGVTGRNLCENHHRSGRRVVQDHVLHGIGRRDIDIAPGQEVRVMVAGIRVEDMIQDRGRDPGRGRGIRNRKGRRSQRNERRKVEIRRMRKRRKKAKMKRVWRRRRRIMNIIFKLRMKRIML